MCVVSPEVTQFEKAIATLQVPCRWRMHMSVP